MNLSKEQLAKYLNKYYIETGSYTGDGIQTALDAGYENVVSIEITKMYYDLCKERFKDNTNVTIVLGDSTKMLPEILNNINESVTIMLDAHYTDNTTKYGEKMCPLIDEIELIKEHAQKYCDTIMIDDMRCWREDNWNYVNYKFNNDDIKNKIKEISNDAEISFEDGYVANDVLVAKMYIAPTNTIDENITEFKKTYDSEFDGNIKVPIVGAGKKGRPKKV